MKISLPETENGKTIVENTEKKAQSTNASIKANCYLTSSNSNLRRLNYT